MGWLRRWWRFHVQGCLGDRPFWWWDKLMPEVQDYIAGGGVMVERAALLKVAREFKQAMLERLLQKLAEGYRGWDAPDAVVRHDLRARLLDNVKAGDWVDVANIAMFIWHAERKKEGT